MLSTSFPFLWNLLYELLDNKHTLQRKNKERSTEKEEKNETNGQKQGVTEREREKDSEKLCPRKKESRRTLKENK